VSKHRRDAETIRHLKALGRAFAEARRKAHLSQVDLWNESGIHQVSIQRIEAGRVDPGYEVMQRLAEGIGVPLGTILDRANELAGEKGED